MGADGMWITGDGLHDCDLKRVRILEEPEDWGETLFFCKGIQQTRGFQKGDWWCARCGVHVWKGRQACGKCGTETPESLVLDIHYRDRFNQHSLKVWDAQNGLVEVWEDRKRNQMWVMQPGSKIEGSGDMDHHVSM